MDLAPVVARLGALSRRLLLRILAEGGSRLLLMGLGLGALTFLLDLWLRLPGAVRGVLLLASLLLLALEARRRLFRPLLRKPGVDELAVLAEAADPGLQDQLISAIQLERALAEGRTRESPELIRRVVAETRARFAQADFRRAVDLRPARRPLLLALAALSTAGLLVAARPDLARLWFERQILLRATPWPQANTLVVTIVDLEKYSPVVEGGRTVLFVPERTPLQLTVTAAAGKSLPPEVLLVARSHDGGGGVQEISLGRAQGRDHFHHVFPPLLRSLDFHVVGGDDQDEDPSFEVRVARAPRIVRFAADYEYPPYTGLEDRSTPDANLSAPEGTRITMRFEVNMDLEEFVIDFEAQGPVQPVRRPDGTWIHALTLTANDFYAYRLRGANGVNSQDSPRYVLTVEPDQAPRVTIELPPAGSLLVTPDALIPIQGTATDDYGVTALEIRHGRTSTALADGMLPLDPSAFRPPLPARQSDFFAAVPTAAFLLADPPAEGAPASPPRPAREGDRFLFKLLVADNRATRAAPGPHRVFSDFEFQVQVLSPRDLERELAQRQTRLRSRMQEIAGLIDRRIIETGELRQHLVAAADAEPPRQAFWNLEQDQSRITTELQAAGKVFVRVYDGYLWNRVDPSFLTEQMISSLSAVYRSGRSRDPFQIYGAALAEVRSRVQEGELMGRLTVILDLMIRCAAELAPEAYRRLALAGLAGARDERLLRLDEAMDAQRALREEVQRLIDRLEAWEDYLDIIQGLRDVQEIQSGVAKKIEQITNK
jgi:hypothetical protein